jgi:hypothetical protein
MTRSPEELAYAAGLFDGEGSIMIRMRQPRDGINPSFSLVVKLANTNRPIIDWLQQCWPARVGACGYAGEPGRRHDAYEWVAQSVKAYAFLLAVRPYLRIKAAEADIGLALQRRVTARRGQPLTPFEIAQRFALREQLYAQPGRGHRRGDACHKAL